MRTVEIFIDAEHLEKTYDAVGDRAPVLTAIGYLSQWNTTGYPICHIFGEDNDTDLLALYHKEASGKVEYVIAAVWNGSSYGFHS